MSQNKIDGDSPIERAISAADQTSSKQRDEAILRLRHNSAMSLGECHQRTWKVRIDFNTHQGIITSATVPYATIIGIVKADAPIHRSNIDTIAQQMVISTWRPKRN